jgi:hypothetical protein
LGVKYEERNSRNCVELWDLSTSEDRTPETYREVAAVISFQKGKWEDISLDFVIGLPKGKKGNDVIWVIMDRLTKFFVFAYENDRLNG